MVDQAVAAGAAGERRFLTFLVDRRLYALPADDVSEVIRIPAAARVPQSPKSLLGMANLRGTILPLASVRALLGIGETAATPAARAIVLDGPAPVALAVDLVDALITLDAGEVETRQSELSAEPGERISGAFRLKTGQAVAKILDVKTLLDTDFKPRARSGRASVALSPVPVARSDAKADEGRLLISFMVADQEYALGVEAVREILPSPSSLAIVPRAESAVLGVAAVRDTLLPLVSLRALLGLPEPASRDGREKVIVSYVADVPVGLVIDRMRSILRPDAQSVEPTPPVLAARAGGETQIRSILHTENGRLILILDPAYLFRADIVQRLAQAAKPEKALDVGEGETVEEDEQRLLVFRLAEEEFGLPISSVDEVARAPEHITHVPKAPKFLEGVVNLRGAVLPVVDQRRRFDLPPFEGDRLSRRLVVVRSERHRAGLIVDSVSEVLSIAVDKIEPAPDLTGETVRLVQGVVNLGDGRRIILLLDPAELLSRAERGLLDNFDTREPAASP
jgi:purine-binding chemotaxis protein CheW